MYLLRLDDASEYMDVEKWDTIGILLDKYDIKPIIGVIPNNQDESLVNTYQPDFNFWKKVKIWATKGWTLALHGYTHVYSSNSGGINPVNFKSEFAGLSLDKQQEKIRRGIQVFEEHQLNPKIFFAPAHTFDMTTLEALKTESHIRIISDTIANNIYKINEFYFIPQQSGRVRRLPFKIATFCYHPNTMPDKDFEELERFLIKYRNKFTTFDELIFEDRMPDLYDEFLKKMYFFIRRIRNLVRGK